MLKCGFSEIDITPEPSEVYLDGYGYRITPAIGVADPLYAKVCAFAAGDERFLLASVDVCGMCPELALRLRDSIALACNLPVRRVAVTATHTHAAPACGVLGDLPINYIYWNNVAEALVAASEKAFAEAEEGYFETSIGGELKSAFNRRGAEKIDRTVRTAAFYNKNGALCGIIASASCHAVIHMENTLSADYPGVMYRNLAEHYPRVPTLFMQGRGADINPYFTEELSSDMMCERLGGELSEAVLKALLDKPRQKKSADITLCTASVDAQVPMSYPSMETLRDERSRLAAESRASGDPTQKRALLRDLDWHMKAIRSLDDGEIPSLTVPIQALILPDAAAFVLLPFELLTETGNSIEALLRARGFTPDQCFIIGYANGTNGYLAPKEEFDAGGYEITGASHWYGIPECTRDSESAVLDAVSRLITDLCTK